MSTSQEIMDLLKDIQTSLDKGLKNYYTEYQLTLPQLTVVTLLGKNTRLKITDLSKEMGISPAAISGIVDRLENQGLVERHRSTEDKRIVFVQLSETFKNSHQHLDQNICGYLQLLLRTLDEKKVALILDGLTTLKEILLSGDEVLSHHIHTHTQSTKD